MLSLNKSPSISSSLGGRVFIELSVSVLRLALSGCLTGGVGIISVKQRPAALGSRGVCPFLLPASPSARGLRCHLSFPEFKDRLLPFLLLCGAS